MIFSVFLERCRNSSRGYGRPEDKAQLSVAHPFEIACFQNNYFGSDAGGGAAGG